MKIKTPVHLSLDGNAVLKEAVARLAHANPAMSESRRNFLRHTLTLGGLSMLTGCTLVDEDSAETVLTHISRLNDQAQAWLFDPKRLAPTYPDAMITRPFPFKAIYSAGGRQAPMEFARTAGHAPNRSGDPPHLRGRLERHW